MEFSFIKLKWKDNDRNQQSHSHHSKGRDYVFNPHWIKSWPRGAISPWLSSPFFENSVHLSVLITLFDSLVEEWSIGKFLWESKTYLEWTCITRNLSKQTIFFISSIHSFSWNNKRKLFIKHLFVSFLIIFNFVSGFYFIILSALFLLPDPSRARKNPSQVAPIIPPIVYSVKKAAKKVAISQRI